MTDTQTQEAPGANRATAETQTQLNEPQPDIYDAPGQTVAYALFHPDEGFAETVTSAIEDFTDKQNSGSAILLFRQRDVAAADRLQRGWSREAQIIPVRIPQLREADDDDDAEDGPPLDPLASGENLADCPSIMAAVEDCLSWFNEQHVRDASEGVRVHPTLRDFLKLLHCFAGDLRIRESRADDVEAVSPGYLIAEHKAGWTRLAAKSEDNVGHMVHARLLRFDGADVICLTDKGRGVAQ